MITIYLVFKLTGLVLGLCVWLITLPFQLIALPFWILFGAILFGKSKKEKRNYEDEDFWLGVMLGSLFF